MQVSAIIPAYNEEGWVGKTVLALRELPEINEIIVVDDGSTDGLIWKPGTPELLYAVFLPTGQEPCLT